MRLVLVALVLTLCSFSVLASQNAMVVTDGALVYRNADFDSKIIGNFKAGARVQVSNNTFGAFYRVRMKQGVLGYIADTDVMTDNKKNSAKPGEAQAPKKAEVKRATPISQRFSVGLEFGAIAFKEFIGKTEYQETLSAIGLKTTFPAGFLQGPFQLEANLFGHAGPPEYYKKFTSSGTASGGIWLFDLVLDYAIDQSDHDVLYLGSGPLVSFTQLKAEVAGKNSDLSEIKAGATILLGYASWFGPLCVRGEVKYFLEEVGYFGGGLALQYDLN